MNLNFKTKKKHKRKRRISYCQNFHRARQIICEGEKGARDALKWKKCILISHMQTTSSFSSPDFFFLPVSYYFLQKGSELNYLGLFKIASAVQRIKTQQESLLCPQSLTSGTIRNVLPGLPKGVAQQF